MANQTKEIIKEIADEFGLSEFDVEIIVKSQFSLLKQLMEEGEYSSIRMKHLGKFTVNPWRIKRIEEHVKGD